MAARLGGEATDHRSVEQAGDDGGQQDEGGAEPRHPVVGGMPGVAVILVTAEQHRKEADQVSEGNRAKTCCRSDQQAEQEQP